MPLMRDIATVLLVAIASGLGACSHNPPLPPDLPKPAPSLMVPPAATPLPVLPERAALRLVPLYEHTAKLTGQCTMDRTRLDHLQRYVKGLTQ